MRRESPTLVMQQFDASTFSTTASFVQLQGVL